MARLDAPACAVEGDEGMSNQDGKKLWASNSVRKALRRRSRRRETRLATLAVVAALTLALGGSYTPPPDASAALAAAFIRELIPRSPSHDGAPRRRYEIRDVNLDGRFEVLERRTGFESALGFLSGIIGAAFDWVDVYREKSGRYELATGEFGYFLSSQRTRYKYWIWVLEADSGVAPRDRTLVEHNREKFISELKGYVQRIDALREAAQ